MTDWYVASTSTLTYQKALELAQGLETAAKNVQELQHLNACMCVCVHVHVCAYKYNYVHVASAYVCLHVHLPT